MNEQTQLGALWKILTGCLLVLVLAMITACQPVQPQGPSTNETSSSEIPEVVIEVDDNAFTIPADMPGGIVAVTVKNTGSKDLDVSFARVRDGSSAEELKAMSLDFMENLVPILQQSSTLATFSMVTAGGEARAVIDFKIGDFLIDATEHAEAEPIPGASHVFGTFSTDEIVGTVEPQTDVKVDMYDFAFVIPDEIEAGPQMWEFANEGGQWHMMFMVKPAAGASVEDVLAAFQEEGEPSGPPPFEFIGNAGVPPISEGERVWLEFSLEPGTYVVGCPLPDLAAMMAGEQPMPHFLHGMYRVLTVTDDTAANGSTVPSITMAAND